MVHIESTIQKNNLDIEADLSQGIIFAFSPIANVTLMQNGNYLITITDRLGTTTAEVPNFTDEVIDRAVQEYIENHSYVQDLIQEHNLSQQAHQDIRDLIQQAIDRIPTRVSELENDQNYVKNAKELMVVYNSYFEFPNIPSEEERDMIFLDKSTGDMYVFGVNDSLAYSSVGIGNNDIINGGDSSSI